MKKYLNQLNHLSEIVSQLMEDILFNLYLYLILLMNLTIIKLMMEVIIKKKYYLILERPYLELLYVQVINNYQNLLLNLA